jgi:hypothetical protein
MPYEVIKRGKKWCVVSPTKTHGCHDSKAKAQRQQRALYENAPPEEESAMTTDNEVTLPPMATEVTGSGPQLEEWFKAAVAAAVEEAQAGEVAPVAEEEVRGPEWDGVLAIEGKPTSDRRILLAGEIDERSLPLPIAAQVTRAEGHSEAGNAGRIDSIQHIPKAEFDIELAAEFDLNLDEMPDGAVIIYGQGSFDTSEWADEGMRMLKNGSGISVDLPADRFALVDPETLEEVDATDMSLEDILMGGYLEGYGGKIGGATIVDVPAFEEASIRIVEDKVMVASAGRIRVLRPRALTAAAGPVKPPAEWFADPYFSELTPLTITKEGQVFGHLADWDGCHIGFQGICVPPFRSATDYAYFNTGEIETAEGDLIPCGKLMFSRDGVGHADVDDEEMTIQDVMDHYDDATCVGAFVRAGADRYGTYLVGALRSDLNDLEIQHLRTHPPSGDWRPIKGVGELIAAFSVPVGGFPIARRALVASANGEISAIISAPLEITEDMGYRKRLRKRKMLSDRLAASLGYRPSTRARMRREAMAVTDDDAA